jgi:hypothetical protein
MAGSSLLVVLNALRLLREDARGNAERRAPGARPGSRWGRPALSADD